MTLSCSSFWPDVSGFENAYTRITSSSQLRLDRFLIEVKVKYIESASALHYG